MDSRKRRYFYSNPRQAGIKSILLSGAIDGFLLTCNARKLSKHTITDYRHTLRKFLVYVGDIPIRDISSSKVSAFLAAQPWTEKTVLNYHIGLSALWTWAIREEYAVKHVVKITPRPKPKKVVVEPFSEQEIRALLSACSGGRNAIRNEAIILLLLDTGIRASELSNLKYSDIDFQRKQILVLGKGNKERFIPFSERTELALFDHMLIEHIKSTGKKPFDLTRRSLTQFLQRLGKKAGVPDCHAHRFRHTFAIHYLRNGADAYSLQDILGHSTMEMCKKYLRIAQVDINMAHHKASPVSNWNL